MCLKVNESLREAARLVAEIDEDAAQGECDEFGDMDCVDFMTAMERKFWNGGNISDDPSDASGAD